MGSELLDGRDWQPFGRAMRRRTFQEIGRRIKLSQRKGRMG
jgi:hypothetical protein